LGIVTDNELHVPGSQCRERLPTFLDLRSADVVHSFWVPRLAGKTDLIPNKVNSMWIEPERTGLFVGQCAKYCGTEHAKMLLRVYVDTREDFDRWVQEQKQLAENDPTAAADRKSTRLNSSHVKISYAVFCWKKKEYRLFHLEPQPARRPRLSVPPSCWLSRDCCADHHV